MFSASFLESDTYAYIIMPALIFLARITDVSIGTIRIIVISRGNKMIAPILGFFEVLIWVIVISNIIQHLNNFYAYLAYAGGFATGNYVGLWIEEKLAIGINLVRIITKDMAHDLMNELHDRGYGATVVNAKGKTDDVSMIYTIVKRKEVNQIVELIHKLNPDAFYTIEDVKYVSHENFSGASGNSGNKYNIFKRWRLGK
jgi:uncharacterized protein YebE (UPF0316 family)